MSRRRRTREEKLRDRQAQFERMADANIAWEYVNNRLKRENQRLRCKLEYLQKMEQEIAVTTKEKRSVE